MKKFLILTLFSLNLVATLPVSYEKIEDQTVLQILNPQLSERKVAKLRLANGLEAFIVSDPGIQQSAAALAVEAGSWNDPNEYPGMAHFLEHMLFMGTKAFPNEFEYMQYISDYGGLVNAYTASDRTVYMYSINNDGFEGALDRFSHFFIDPLFLSSSIDRELHAVDQEHAKNIEHDMWRQYMIFKETANPNHPCAKFSTGNADTLRGIPQAAMKEWYNTHYSAEKMHLVILSNLPLEKLTELTLQHFSLVPNQQVATEVIKEQMTSDKQRGHFIYIKPVKDLKVLSLSWELPEMLAEDQEARVGQLIAYALENGGKNSLLSLLKQEHLSRAISVKEEQLGKGAKLFNIDIELTDKGLQEVDKVTTYTFQTIARLKKTGVPRYLFNEVQKIAELKYQYQSRQEAFSFVQEMAHTLVDEQLETFPQKTLVPSAYEPELTARFLNFLTAENCIFFLIADPEKTGVAPSVREKWMGAEYTVKAVDPKQLQAWSNSSTHSKIALPTPNLFLPKKLDLVHATPSEEAITPTLIEESDKAKIFYSADHHYLIPETSYLFRVKSPKLDGSSRSKALTDLYLLALRDQLFPITSSAEQAGSEVSVTEDHFSLFVNIHGFSEPSQRLTEEVFAGMKKVRPSKSNLPSIKPQQPLNTKTLLKSSPSDNRWKCFKALSLIMLLCKWTSSMPCNTSRMKILSSFPTSS
jgi:insulysin